jgi:spore cortex biosynthesis protein YabQ
MTDSINTQAYVFLCSVAAGMVIALVYDILRIIRRTVKTGSLLTGVQDLIYWLIAALIMFLSAYYSNSGQLRAYLFVGMFIGVVLYALLLSKSIMRCSQFVIKIIVSFFKTLVFVVSYPVRMLMKVAAVTYHKGKRIIENVRKKQEN